MLAPLVIDAYGLALRHRWRLLTVVVPVLALAQLLSFLIPAIASGVDGATVNGQLMPSDAVRRWSEVELRLAWADSDLRAAIPVVLLIGWLIAIAACVPVFADIAAQQSTDARRAWRSSVSRLPTVAALAAAAALAIVGVLLVAGLAVAVSPQGLEGAAAAVVLGFGAIQLARLSLAWPAALIEGHGAVAAMARAVSVTRGRSWRVGLAVGIGVGAVPAFALSIAHATSQGLTTAGRGGRWGIALFAAVLVLIGTLVLSAVVPAQASVLTACFQFASDAADGPLASEAPGAESALTTPMVPSKRTVSALLAVALVPALIAAGYPLANPYRAPVVFVQDAPGWSLSSPRAIGTFPDGSPVLVGSIDITRCTNLLCSVATSVSLPCNEGATPRKVSDGVTACSIEAPLEAATVRPDGTVVAVRRGHDNAVRLLSCDVTDAEQCGWGGASAIHQLPGRWERWALAVAQTSDGGVVVALLAPAKQPDQAQVTLIFCADLACPKPQARPIGTVPTRDGWFGGGPLAMAVDPVSGNVAVVYRDAETAAMWLGGCAAPTCAEAGLRQIRPGRSLASAHFVPDATADPVVVAATATGPVTALTDAGNMVTVLQCTDPTCASHDERVAIESPPGGPQLVSHDGNVYLVGAQRTGRELRMALLPLPAPTSPGPGATLLSNYGDMTLRAAHLDSHGRLRLLLTNSSTMTMVTCVDRLCRPRNG